MDLREEIKRCHDRTSRSDSTDLISTWTERELYREEIKDVFSMIFRTRGCSWSYSQGCSMCGYYTDTNPEMTGEEIEGQLDDALKQYDGEDVVKIYTSGSFLDKREISSVSGLNILSSFDAEKILIESRPEYIEENREILSDYIDAVENLEVAIGLESASDFIRDRCINKGFTFKDYERARDIVLDMGAKLRTYLLLKPPFLTETEAVEDVLNSIDAISPPEHIISINPVNVQNGSLVEMLWRRGGYRPPWLWSLVDVLTRTQTDSVLVSSKAGLGSERGAHNCGECDDEIIEAVDEFNLNQDGERLKEKVRPLDCDCRQRWNVEKDIEPFMYYRGSPEVLSDRYAGDL